MKANYESCTVNEILKLLDDESDFVRIKAKRIIQCFWRQFMFWPRGITGGLKDLGHLAND